MFIITNTTCGGEYTPSKANTFEEAKAWLFECTANNIRAWKGIVYPELNDMSNEEVLKWAEEQSENGEIDFYFSGDSSEIHYDNNSYNIMNIYDLNKI